MKTDFPCGQKKEKEKKPTSSSVTYFQFSVGFHDPSSIFTMNVFPEFQIVDIDG